jgi:hypothetical protein
MSNVESVRSAKRIQKISPEIFNIDNNEVIVKYFIRVELYLNLLFIGSVQNCQFIGSKCIRD